MSYCIHCGQEIPPGAKFCAGCGEPTNDNNSTTQRKTVYDGEIHKCPNCGDIIDAYESVCEACGYEIRDRNAPAANNIPVIQIESRTALINDTVEYNISERLKETFGVTVSGVDISAIEIDKSSVGYRELMSVTKDLAGATVKAEASAKIKDIADKQRIEAEHYEEALRVQREETQYAQHMHTRTANFGAYQVEKQAEVGVAGAEALGKMGANGAGTINLGGDSSNGGMGFNPAAMMASMAVGGAVGQNIAGAMNNMMSGINQQTTPGAVPPPIPTVAYHVAVNGQATGPFDISVLAQMATAGQLTVDSLVWKNGMAQWAKAGTVDELKNLFVNAMPPIPPVTD